MTAKRVLYVDDDFLSGRLFEILLRDAGVVCDFASDGSTAVTMFASAHYDAVVLDAYLPRLDGTDVADRIRQMDATVPLFGITSDAEAAHCLEQAGLDRVFLKPLRGGKCLDYLLSQLQRQS